jgi:hypothetical protein
VYNVENYLDIENVFDNEVSYTTRLFVNQKEKRLHIEFNFNPIGEQITIIFGPRSPASPPPSQSIRMKNKKPVIK